MKIHKTKKNDRAAFFNLPETSYSTMSKKERRRWRKSEACIGSLAQLFKSTHTP